MHPTGWFCLLVHRQSSLPGDHLFVSVITTCQRLNIKLPSCRAWCGAILEPSRSPLSRVRQPWLVSRPRDNEGFPEATPSLPPGLRCPSHFDDDNSKHQHTHKTLPSLPACGSAIHNRSSMARAGQSGIKPPISNPSRGC